MVFALGAEKLCTGETKFIVISVGVITTLIGNVATCIVNVESTLLLLVYRNNLML